MLIFFFFEVNYLLESKIEISYYYLIRNFKSIDLWGYVCVRLKVITLYLKKRFKIKKKPTIIYALI